MIPKDESGFTLVEVLVAMVIFAIGILAVINMQYVSSATNLKSRMITEAIVVAQGKIEEMRGWGYDHVDLADNNGDGLLTTAVESTAGETIEQELADTDATDFGDPRFELGWNVIEDSPYTDTKTIRVVVKWYDNTIKQTFAMDMVKSDGD